MPLNYSCLTFSYGGSIVKRFAFLVPDPAAPGSNPGSSEIFFSLLLSLWTVKRSNPSSAKARDFTNADSGEGLSY